MQDCYLVFYMSELAGATFMLFTRTCDNTRKLALMLRNLGFDAIPIHGQMSQPKRLGALNKFKAGERSILVATGGLGVLAWKLVERIPFVRNAQGSGASKSSCAFRRCRQQRTGHPCCGCGHKL